MKILSNDEGPSRFHPSSIRHGLSHICDIIHLMSVSVVRSQILMTIPHSSCTSQIMGRASRSASKASSRSEVNSNKRGSIPAVPMKPSPPDHLPSSDAEWDAFLKGLDHEEDGEAPSSSMLSFVLKNLRHGADLSKMPLPTWFLQKRSILEAYSDFFRNSDEFVKIAKQKSPQARMEQCLRWFLVGFNAHFHKLTNIAKKPFNSILGETFTGEFVLDKNCKEKNVDSPWPWTSTNNLIFSGEQVSHHPPISAFYVECSSARIYADCHLMVVAKFRGFHVKAKNIGSMNVHLPDQGEEYVVKLPNGYGRSLFTTPWVEAGDEGSITCAKTGYSVEMKFHTKSLFGSERNKMEAKMTGPPNSANQPVYFQGGPLDRHETTTSSASALSILSESSGKRFEKGFPCFFEWVVR